MKLLQRTISKLNKTLKYFKFFCICIPTIIKEKKNSIFTQITKYSVLKRKKEDVLYIFLSFTYLRNLSLQKLLFSLFQYSKNDLNRL